jgi:outer membrane protein OmpA-like peptidoglycan-associated protein
MSLPKVLLMLLVWLLYTIVAYKGCIEECCTSWTGDATTEAVTDTDTTDAATTTVDPANYAIASQWDDPAVSTNDGFESLKERILSGMTDDNILEITGLYYEGEAKPDSFENFGFARSEEIRKLFAELPDDRIRFRARLQDEGDNTKTGFFESGVFEWIEAEKQDEAPELEELDDRTIIRFPSNSTTRIADPAVDEYLKKLSERVKTSGEQITITGHADNVGDDELNMRLSRKRAERVRDILIGKGVSKDQITVSYKGETQPVASNDTESGRQENRRAEVRLIKQ